MKRVEELGISPLPWRITEWNPFAAVESASHVVGIVATGKIGNEADASLIAAAPELYEALRDAVDIACARCQTANAVNCDLENNPCHSCLPGKWREVLAKASGDEVAK